MSEIEKLNADEFIHTLQFDSQGLIPAVIQDAGDKAVLMLGYMNQTSLRQTLDSGRVTFWSRSRKKLWTKGETSGHWLLVKSIYTDCDRDTLLIQVEAIGPTCHTNKRSCFSWLLE